MLYSDLSKEWKELSDDKKREFESLANDLMLVDNTIWSVLGIKSGSDLQNNKELMDKYLDAIEKSVHKGIPALVYMELQDNNYHHLNTILRELSYFEPEIETNVGVVGMVMVNGEVELQDGDKVPLVNGNMGLYEEGAKADFFVGSNVVKEKGTGREVDSDEVDWVETSKRAEVKLNDFDDLVMEGVDIVVLKNGNEGMYWNEYYEHAEAIWDLDSGEYVQRHGMIDWDHIKKDPKSVIKKEEMQG